jgi:sporulation protein YlmC with PRC-barrel domain
LHSEEKSKEQLNYLEDKIKNLTAENNSEVGGFAIFENAINVKDYSKLTEILAKEIYYSENGKYLGKIIKEEAIFHLKEYLQDKDTFNFSQNQEEVKNVKIKATEEIENHIIGLSERKAILGYKINSDGEVNNIYVNNSCDFLNGE